MFTTLEIWLAVEYNPATKIAELKVAESNKYAAYTPEEKDVIADHLCRKHYSYFVFVQFLYHTGIRPKEALALRIRDIDLKRQLITIVPNLEEENSKTTTIPVFINILQKAYKIRYYDKLEEPVKMGFFLNQFIGELDSTIHYLENNETPGLLYGQAIRSKDPNLYQNNFILNNQNKKAFMEKC